MPLVKPMDSLFEYTYTFNNIKSSMSLYSFENEDKSLLEQVSKLEKGKFAMATTQVDDYCAGHTDLVSLENPNEGWGWLIDKGFNAICTDYPIELLAYLRKRGCHK